MRTVVSRRPPLGARFLWLCIMVYAAQSPRAFAAPPVPGEESAMAFYSNPFTLDEEWPDYGIGDPFAMRFNGRYYLYCSTKDHRPGIKAWSSADLVRWRYEGLVTEDAVSTGAYAPEVAYWNGFFYLYTSPAGKGHYVYRAESPTGPFTRVTGNLGCSIDGSVFVDDDGSWYYYNAGGSGIVGHRMADPLTPGDGTVLAGTFMGHWTEGPCMIKRQGTYFLTFTGNHVFSTGYRVSCASSDEGPLAVFPQPDTNPILISTSPDFHGLGHSSTVLGPDMDSWFILYHNLTGSSREGPPVRKLNIDRLAFSGRKMAVLGPTHSPQPVPRMPDFVMSVVSAVMACPDGALDLSGGRTGPVFTAELNLSFVPQKAGVSAGAATAGAAASGAVLCGAAFSVEDAANYEAVAVEPASNELVYWACRAGVRGPETRAVLPAGFDFSKLHVIRVEREPDRVTVHFDQMRKITVAAPASRGGAIGFIRNGVKPVYGFMGFTNQAAGSSDSAAYKPVPGILEAVHAVGADQRGSTVEGPGGSLAVTPAAFAAGRVYRINVDAAGTYAVDAMVFTPERQHGEPVVLEARVDRQPAARLTIPPNAEGASVGWYPLNIGNVTLPAGLHELELRLADGVDGSNGGAIEDAAAKAAVESFTFHRASRPAAALTRLEADPDTWERFGEWTADAGGMHAMTDGKTGPMCCIGDPTWENYTLEADVTLERKEIYRPFGLLMHASQESFFPAQVQDSFFGYYLELTGGKASLYRVKYDLRELLDSCMVDLDGDRPVHVTLTTTDGLITVRVATGRATTGFSVRDPVGLPTGRIGLYSHESGARFSNVTVRP